MFQAPQQSKGFSKGELADITRGVKKPLQLRKANDPLIDLVARADRSMIEWIVAHNNLVEKEEALPEGDANPWPRVTVAEAIPDLPQWVLGEFGHYTYFVGPNNITNIFNRHISQAKQRIQNSRRSIRAIKANPTLDAPRLIEAHKRDIVRDQRIVDDLPRFERAVQKAWRKESRRIRLLHKQTGLTAARNKGNRARAKFREAADNVHKATPQTIEGALAAIAYVEQRLLDEKPDQFRYWDAKEGLNPFARLLSASMTLIRRKAAPDFKLVRGVYEQPWAK